ncbi:glycosyl hydrolase family 92-domain-containing protein [Phyllosticta citrichinensis]|uniref:Glycosyl hydrolase family 92-domain-containing protein n=1 Tax=Phyllosticta citrichinensis TaxID=1130410 RepID=A0ABR1XNZ9_9PEZI
MISSLLVLLALRDIAFAQNISFDVLDFIDPLIGSNNGGNVFSGATLPYSMAKAVADVYGQNTGGFSTDGSNVIEFSSMHDSGTGGNPSLANFPWFPQHCPENDINNCKYPKSARATPYKPESVLQTNITAEMVVAEHTALYHFTFPEATASNGSALNPQIWSSRQNASISIDPSTGRIKGNGTFLPSFGAGTYQLHFWADFAGGNVYESGMYVNNSPGTEPKDLFVTRGFNLFYLSAGGFVRFDRPADGKIAVRQGMSFISADKACQNAESEIPDLINDFPRLRSEAEDTWRAKLSPISLTVGNVSQDLQKIFWSSIYRTMISPQNYTGENPRWDSPEYWPFPFLSVIYPIIIPSMARSLLYTYRNEGWLPDCRMSLSKGWTQGGSNADVVLADAYVKNMTGIDGDLAYKAMPNDAENEPLEWSKEGRDYDYLGFGTNSRSISRSLEYSYNDFCIGHLGRALGKDGYETYLSRSDKWQNLFKADQTSFINGTDTGFVGFFQPKYLNRTCGFQDPVACSPVANFCSLTSNPSETFESSVWEYLFFVPHDTSKLIKLLGGDQAFAERRDYFHNSPLVEIGNEPVFLSVFEYHYAGRPGLSANRSHFYIPSRFNTSQSGLPGNDDSGAMGSFTAFNMLGLFPNPAKTVTSPLTNNTATIRSINFDTDYKNIYIQNATLNGQPYTKNWIGHEFFLDGGELVLTLGDQESEWGRAVEDRPPSLSDSSAGIEISDL